jgi:hypothetical protein
MDYDVFISHASQDKVVAHQVCESLEAAGVRCWIAPRNIRPAMGWAASIEQDIRRSRMLLLLFSASANESEHVKREVELAFSEPKAVLPVRIQECKPTGSLRYYLHPVQWFDALTPPFASYLPTLTDTVQQLLAAADSRLSLRPRRAIPDLLHYHCDRDDQESQLEAALNCGETDGPLVCIIHGDEDQCHDEFLERLRRVSLPRLFGLDQSQVGIKEYAINYPSSLADAPKFRDQLLRNLGRRILTETATSVLKVAGFLAGFPSPVVIQFRLLTDEWLRGRRASIEPFLDFWAEWPAQPAKYRLLVCLLVTYRAGPQQGWFAWYDRWILRRANACLRAFLCSLACPAAPRSRIILLDELRGVTQNELEVWSQDEYTREFCGDRDLLAEVRALCRRPGFRDREGRVAMEKVANELKKILLAQRSAGWETG